MDSKKSFIFFIFNLIYANCFVFSSWYNAFYLIGRGEKVTSSPVRNVHTWYLGMYFISLIHHWRSKIKKYLHIIQPYVPFVRYYNYLAPTIMVAVCFIELSSFLRELVYILIILFNLSEVVNNRTAENLDQHRSRRGQLLPHAVSHGTGTISRVLRPGIFILRLVVNDMNTSCYDCVAIFDLSISLCVHNKTDILRYKIGTF